jgi:hypothetical protein
MIESFEEHPLVGAMSCGRDKLGHGERYIENKGIDMDCVTAPFCIL